MKLLKSVSLPTSSTALKTVNVLFEDKIIKLSTDDIEVEEDVQIIDAKGLLMLPGGIDPHTHILAENADAATDLAKITKIALEGGWTTLAELSYHTQSPVFNNSALKKKIALVNANSFTSLALWGHIDIGDYPYHAESAQEIWSKGIVGIALAVPSPNPAIPDITFTEIMDLFFDIYESDTSFAFQGYDYESYQEFSPLAQLDAIKKILRRMQENPIHIPRISSYPTIEFINSVSKRSDISFATCISDLMALYNPDVFSTPFQCDYADFADLLFDLLRSNKIYLLSNCVSPPVKNPNYCELFKGCNPELMNYSYLWVLSELWKKRKVPLATCLKMTSENAAKRLGIYPEKGSLDPGSDADFVLYDPEATTIVKGNKGKNIELSGSFKAIYLKGNQVAGQDFATIQQGSFLARSTNPKRRHNNSSWI